MKIKMNLKNMRRLRWRLQRKNDPIQFRMNHWWSYTKFKSNYDDRSVMIDWDFINDYPCQSAACIAGYAVIIAIKSGDIEPVGNKDIHTAAQEWLGMSCINADRLFMGRWADGTYNLKNITKAQAVAQLTQLINDYEKDLNPK